MKYLKQFAIILVLSLIGEVLHACLPLPVPASIYGIVILLLCLETGMIRVDAVKEVSVFFIAIMPVLFIPAAVGVIESWQMIQTKLAAYIAITVITTVLVMAVSGKAVQSMIRLLEKKEDKHE